MSILLTMQYGSDETGMNTSIVPSINREGR